MKQLKTYLTALTVVILVSINSIYCAVHFEYQITDVNASILVKDIVLTEIHIGEGDELGVFSPRGVCGGAALIEDFPIGIPAFADDQETDSIDGFEHLDSIRFVYWDADLEEEFDLAASAVLEGSLHWRAQSLTVLHLTDEGRLFTPNPSIIEHFIHCQDVRVYTGGMDFFTPDDFDQIGILTPDGDVAGILVWNEELESASGWAFGDDPDTELDEGFDENEDLRFTYVHIHSGTEYSMMVNVLQGDENFSFEEGSSELELLGGDYFANKEVQLPDKVLLVGSYPNPFNSITNLQIKSAYDSIVELVLFDASGRRINGIERHIYVRSGINHLPLELTGLSAGDYFIMVSNQEINNILRITLIK